MINSSGILEGKSIGTGDIGTLFNISMMTQIRELESERHTQMCFVEFVEAICRVAYKMQEFPEQLLPRSMMKRTALLGNSGILLINPITAETIDTKKGNQREVRFNFNALLIRSAFICTRFQASGYHFENTRDHEF